MNSTYETDAPSRPQRKDVIRNRELLLQAGREVFAERGLTASLDEIARHAGLGIGTAYRHFANKHELATAVMRQSFQQLVSEFDRLIELDDPWQGVVELFESVMTLQNQDRGLHEAFTGITTWDQMEPERQTITDRFEKIFDRAQAAGKVRDDATFTDMALLLMMFCSLADIIDDENSELWRRFLPMMLEGLKPGGTALPVLGLTADQLQVAIAKQKGVKEPLC